MEFLSIDFTSVLHTIKIIAAILSLLFFAGGVYYYIKLKDLDEEQEKRWNEHFVVYDKEEKQEKNIFVQEWERMKPLFFSPSVNDWKIAVMEADGLMEKCIESAFALEGNSFGEKLKQISSQKYPFMNEVWRLHKLRNSLAHNDPNLHFVQRDALNALRGFESIFKKLSCL